MRHAWATALLLAVFVTLAPGCKQAEGDRCQLDSDCEDGLVCCIDQQQANLGGVCQPQGKCGPTPADAGSDGTVTDGAPDGELPPDQGPSPDSAATPDQGPAPDVTPTPDTTSAPDQQSSVDTFAVDLASQG